MDRTLPRYLVGGVEMDAEQLQVDIVRRGRWAEGTLLTRPHYRSPPGVTMRPLAEGESNREPVLVCKVCDRPEPHVRTTEPPFEWSCKLCGTARRW